MNKVRQTDALLRRIVDRLERRFVAPLELAEAPAVEDGAVFEELLWDYKEHQSQNTASIGLRNRVPNKDPELDDISGLGDRMQIAVNHIRQGIVPPAKIADEFIKRAKKYLAMEIPVGKFLGERERKPRDGYTWQAEATMPELAEITFKRVRSARGRPLDTSRPDLYSSENLYWLLTELSKLANPNSKPTPEPSTNLGSDSELKLNKIHDSILKTTDLTEETLADLINIFRKETECFNDDLIQLIRNPSRWHKVHKNFRKKGLSS